MMKTWPRILSMLIFISVIVYLTVTSLDKYHHVQKDLPQSDRIVENSSLSTKPQPKVDPPVAKHPYFQPFPWKILPKNVCLPKNELLFVVHSMPSSRIRRDAIRATYGSKNIREIFNVGLVFAMGTMDDPIEETRLQAEAHQFGDIVQADFREAYRNLTIKHLTWMRYTRDYCPKVKLVIKIDDDTLPNIFILLKDYLDGKIPTRRTFTGSDVTGQPVYRDPNSDWYVPMDVYPKKEFDPYLSGAGIIQSTDMIPELIRHAEASQKYISVDDAFVTGILRKEIGASRNTSLYMGRYRFYDHQADMGMMREDAVFCIYKSSVKLRRLFRQLEYRYGFLVDPDDDSDRDYKIGHRN